jgi:hypothetical protein
MSYREHVQAMLDRFTFTPVLAAFKPHLTVDTGPPYPRRDRVRCVLVLTFPDRGDGDSFVTRTAFNLAADATPQDAQQAVFRVLLDRLMHEAAEAVCFDGALFADPHARPRLWPWRVADQPRRIPS